MSHGERESFKNPIINWIDERLPLFTMMNKEYAVFPTPKNFNYLWNFGAIAMFMLVTMILSGIFLAMEYTPSTDHAFNSVERIMRDVNWGWMLRYVHANGASMFFIAVYIHIFRGMFYGSYKNPRELLWILGVAILLLMMATAFMGYVLPWGQMSFWGATVITNLFSAIPLVGQSIVTWLWGGFSVDNPTLNRFYALHYLLPFVIVGVVFLHVVALHITGSNNPTGVEPKSAKDTVPFHPYYTTKDFFGLSMFLIFYVLIVFWAPNYLGHPDNYIPANPMATPEHIVPEWYFLPFYAILRSITFSLGFPIANSTVLLVLFGVIGLGAFLVTSYMVWKTLNTTMRNRDGFTGLCIVLSKILLPIIAGGIACVGVHYIPYIAAQLIDLASSVFGEDWEPVTHLSEAFRLAVVFIPAKLGGVVCMFGSIAVLFVLPFLDCSPVRSCVFRPWLRKFFWLLVIDCVVLGYVGGKPPEGLFVVTGQVATFFYFAYFLIIIPLLARFEKTLPLPNSISESVLKKN